MTNKNLSITNDNEQEQLLLKVKINLLQKELNDIELVAIKQELDRLSRQRRETTEKEEAQWEIRSSW